MTSFKGTLSGIRISRTIASIAFSILLIITLVGFLGLGNTNSVLLILTIVLVAERFLYNEEFRLNISTLRINEKSILISDRKRKVFLALSFVEVKARNTGESLPSSSEEIRTKSIKAGIILAEHVGTLSIEVDCKTSSMRYVTAGFARTASEACQKAEASAGRVLRTIKELYGSNDQIGIVEGEQVRDVFLSTIGGDFDVLVSKSGAVLRRQGRTNIPMSFLLMRATHRSIGIINVRKIVSLARDLDVDATYVISLKANRAYNENILIDGAGNSQTWQVSSFFVMIGSNTALIREKARVLKNRIENITRGGALKIERSSITLDRIGEILLRSFEGKKLLLSNEELISHISTIWQV